MTTARRNRMRARFGAGLIAASVAAAMLAVPGGVVAQEEGEAPKGEPVEVTKEALYAKPSGNAAPNTVTSEFPPGVVCLVRPELCNDDAQQVTGPISDGLKDANVEDTPDNQSPQQAKNPDTLTVAQNSGEQHYASGFTVAVPKVPVDREVVSATLTLFEDAPTYHTSSPFFRQMMLAALAGVRDQQAAREEAQKAIMGLGGQYPPAENDLGNVGVELCPFTEPFDEGSHEWSDTPAFDCIFGTNGVRTETPEGNVWVFDLTFTMAAWADGTIPNHGLYLRATAAPNLAFGDPDTTWYSQVSFSSQGADQLPLLDLQTVKAASDGPSTFVPPPSNTGSNSGSSSSGQGSFFTPPQAFPSGESSAPAVGGGAPVQQPEVAGNPQPQVAPQAAGQQVPASAAVTPWWVWLLVPTFLAGMFLVSQSLTAEVGAVATREGAMTRLIRQRTAGELSTATPQFQV